MFLFDHFHEIRDSSQEVTLTLWLIISVCCKNLAARGSYATFGPFGLRTYF